MLHNLDNILVRVKSQLAELNNARMHGDQTMGRVEANFRNHLVDASILVNV